MSELKCPICGEPTYMHYGHPRKDGLCAKHGQMANAKKIVQCEDCGKFHDADKPCSCKTPKKAPIETPQEEFAAERKHPFERGRCIVCGYDSNDKMFCPRCYHKYRNKTVLVRISGCTEIEIVDEEYEGNISCKDGHIVKSKSERSIDDYLFEHGIPHAYERELHYGPGQNDVIKPDFFLPNFLGSGHDVWIEHWGYDENNIQYTRSKKFKMDIYKKAGITLICTHERTDIAKIDTTLEWKLNINNIKFGEINFDITD